MSVLGQIQYEIQMKETADGLCICPSSWLIYQIGRSGLHVGRRWAVVKTLNLIKCPNPQKSSWYIGSFLSSIHRLQFYVFCSSWIFADFFQMTFFVSHHYQSAFQNAFRLVIIIIIIILKLIPSTRPFPLLSKGLHQPADTAQEATAQRPLGPHVFCLSLDLGPFMKKSMIAHRLHSGLVQGLDGMAYSTVN